MGILRRALYTKEVTVGSPYGEFFILFVYASKSISSWKVIFPCMQVSPFTERGVSFVCVCFGSRTAPHTRLPLNRHKSRGKKMT